MKQWILWVSLLLMFVTALPIVIIMNPGLAYDRQTVYKDYIVFHNKPFDYLLLPRLDEAVQLVRSSECYLPNHPFQVCLNDGSFYPTLIQKIRGEAFAWGFYNKVVLQGKNDYKNNYAELNGYKWNLSQLLAHEMIHCMQFQKLGWWGSNPLAGIPEWKWEGYPEYMARISPSQKDLSRNIRLLVQTEQTNHNNWIQFSDNTGSMIAYYRYCLLIQYCMTVKKMSFMGIIADATPEEIVRQQMEQWHRNQPETSLPSLVQRTEGYVQP